MAGYAPQNLTPKQMTDGIRVRCNLPPDSLVGIVSSYGKKAQVEGDGRTLDMNATTDDIDLQDEVVVPGGADTTYFATNRKVFGDHQYGLLDVVGICRSIDPIVRGGSQKGWRVKVYMLPGNAIADAVLALADEDGIGCSIGFQATEYGAPTPDEAKSYSGNKGAPSSIVRKWNWLELSMTAFPCNVACQTLRATHVDHAKSVLDRLVCKGKITRLTAAAMGLEDAGRGQRRRILV